MNPALTLVHDHIGPSLINYAQQMRISTKETVRRAAKGVTRRILELTPPASAGSTGAAAYRQGRAKIARQMQYVLAPVRLKGRRQINTVFGRRISRPVYVPTKEQHPDVAAAYRGRTRVRSSGVGIRATSGQKLYVDVRKFKAVLKAKEGRVGKLASGWAPAANAFDVPLQAWVSRHVGNGSVRLDLNTSRQRITVINYAPGAPEEVRAHVRRQIGYAVTYQRDAMGRAIDNMVIRLARQNRMRTTRPELPIIDV